MDVEPEDERRTRGATTLHLVLLAGAAVGLSTLILLALLDLWGRSA